MGTKNKKHLAERYATFAFIDRGKALGARFLNFETIFQKRHIRKAYTDGWNACLEHLSVMTREQAINEIKNYCKERRTEV